MSDRLNEPTRLVTRADVLVALAGLALAGLIASVRWFGFGEETTSTLYAVIQNTEGFYQVLPLDEDAALTVEGSLGYNEVEVTGGRVHVVEADCANQVCVRTGWASVEGQTITCLPHKLVVQVVADPADAAPLV